jgi:hypothetical protein
MQPTPHAKSARPMQPTPHAKPAAAVDERGDATVETGTVAVENLVVFPSGRVASTGACGIWGRHARGARPV